jgi:hypothetical protein
VIFHSYMSSPEGRNFVTAVSVSFEGKVLLYVSTEISCHLSRCFFLEHLLTIALCLGKDPVILEILRSSYKVVWIVSVHSKPSAFPYSPKLLSASWIYFHMYRYIHTLHYITLHYITLHTYIQTYIHTYSNTAIQIYSNTVHTYIHTYIHYITLYYIHTHTHIHIRIYIYTYNIYIYLHMHTHIHVHVHIYIYV